MNCSRYHPTIGEYVDGTLTGPARADVEVHLSACPACRALVADVRALTAAARQLDVLTPSPGAWAAIAERLEQEGAQGLRPVPFRLVSRRALKQYTWLAAAAMLMLVTASVLFVLRNRPDTDEAPASLRNASARSGEATPGSTALVESVQSELQLAEEHYDKAIAKMEQIAASEEPSLDPKLVSALRKNLGVIDQAIAESRAALRSQPGSVPAQESLFEALRRKVGLLQDTIALMNEMRKGNQAGAAEIVEGLNKS